MYRLSMFLLVLVLALSSRADVIIEGTVYKAFTFTNLDDYPEYDFFITYQTYRYYQGYKPAGEVTEQVVQGEEYQPPRGGEASFTAQHKTTGVVLKADKLLGGTATNAKVRWIVDKITINKITENQIELDIEYGSTKSNSGVKKGSLDQVGVWGIVAFSGLALVLFVWQTVRKRKRLAA